MISNENNNEINENFSFETEFSNSEIEIINSLKNLQKKTLSIENFSKILRIYKSSISIAKKEKITNLFKISIISLIYENFDSNEIKNFLNEKKLFFTEIEKIKNFNENLNSIECKIVRDAEILDFLGAIGIYKCFSKNEKIYSFDNNENSCYNEFYEKLFKLKNFVFSNEAKKIALKKTEFMIKFIKQFNSETFLDYFQNEYEKFEKIEKEIKKEKIKNFKQKMNQKINNLIQKEKINEKKRINLINECDNLNDKFLLEKIFGKQRAKNVNNLEQTKINIKNEIKNYKEKNK
jgi:hypothetical protein